MPTKQSTTLAKGLRLLEALIADGGRSPLKSIAERMGMPLPTAHRLALTLETEGYIERQIRGHFYPGEALAGFGIIRGSLKERVAARLRHPLARLAQSHRAFMHFGVLEEGMVTYLVKENGSGQDLFTAEQMQLEAYCSAVGKVLLAALSTDELESYLANGPFVSLTRNTLTDPEAIRLELESVRKKREAFDRGEIREDLFCMAVPVTSSNGEVIGALSASFVKKAPDARIWDRVRRSLRKVAAKAVETTDHEFKPISE